MQTKQEPPRQKLFHFDALEVHVADIEEANVITQYGLPSIIMVRTQQ